MKELRKLKLHYLEAGAMEWATIETVRGWYVCDVFRCSKEGRRKFRQRARCVLAALESYPHPMILTSPDEV